MIRGYLVIRNTLGLVVRVRERHWLVVLPQHFCQIMLQRGKCCADAWRSESVSDRARNQLEKKLGEVFVPELRERLLNTLVKNWSRFCVADRRTVLRQKILQFFHDISKREIRFLNRAVRTRLTAVNRGLPQNLLGREAHVLSRVNNFGIVVLPANVFGQLFRRKFCLADVSKISREMNCFSFDQRRLKSCLRFSSSLIFVLPKV